MPRLLKIMIPYVVAVFGAVLVFGAGAWAAMWFFARVTSPSYGTQQVSDLVIDHTLLHSLDAGNVDEARSLLISLENNHVMALDMTAPYLPDALTKPACRIMQKVAKQRTDNAAKYSAMTSNPEVRQTVDTMLQNPAACARAK